MENALVSIIITVYQTEKYLSRCLDSIITQSLKDLEIILVDDGSSDESGAICEKYALIDNRIKVIHQINRGVSVARQTGLDAAQGSYTIYVDSDDWIEPTAIENLFEKASKDNADMVISDYWIECDDHDPYLVKQNCEDLTSYQIMLRLLNQELFGSCWNKLIKREIIEKYHIKFYPEHITFCEDLLFNSKLLSKNIKVSYLDKPIYHYCLSNQQNLTNTLSIKRLESRIYVNRDLEKLIKQDEMHYLFNQKKDVLREAFLLKQFSVFKNYYPDAQAQIIKNRRPTDYYFSKYLCMAFKGHPYIAYYLFKIRRFATNIRHYLIYN